MQAYYEQFVAHCTGGAAPAHGAAATACWAQLRRVVSAEAGPRAALAALWPICALEPRDEFAHPLDPDRTE